MSILQSIVKRYWGFDSFLPLQQEAMQCALEGRDSLVVLPTGGGKSLCFQAPAVAMEGMAVVVSPLLSLMKDQVDALRTNGVHASKIDSMMTTVERRQVHEDIQRRAVKLLYVSPERLVKEPFIEYLKAVGVSFFVVDEAHCISHWGHDFRPEYRELKLLRALFPDKSIHAFTATATQHVRDDIVSELNLRDPSVLVGCFDRPNLSYRVVSRSRGHDQMKMVVDAHLGEPGIIYCIRRADVETVCEWLAQQGHKALPYHAGMDDGARKRNQDAFSNEEADIIVATVAFGMGIDKSNVRYIIHAAMPKSIEHYQQETGRAGRDGLSADCWMFYSYQDFKIWEGILLKNASDDNGIALAKLRDIQRYCDRAVCRHKGLSEYFGQRYAARNCGACDVCVGEEQVDNASEIAQTILGVVILLGGIAGPTYTTLVLTGTREERVLAKGHHHIPGFGALAVFEAHLVRDWIEQLVEQEFLVKTGEYNVLGVTQAGHDLLDGHADVRLGRPAEKASRAPRARRTAQMKLIAPLSQLDISLFQVLRKALRKKARELDVAPSLIFSDATLRDMARKKPADTKSFLAIYGMGQQKCDEFGEEFLHLIREFCEEHPESPPALMEARPPKKHYARQTVKTELMARASDMFARGCSVEEVAEQLDRAPGTVAEYLEAHINEHGITDPSPWVDSILQQRIYDAIQAVGGERLKPIRGHLNDDTSYAHIRICAACHRNAKSKVVVTDEGL